jgi:hypothetical protein
LAATLSHAERRRHGRYFTPPELVDFTFGLAAPWVPALRAIAIIDPACGSGAFLERAPWFFPTAPLFGLEISAQLARVCRQSVPDARVAVGDALRGGLTSLLSKLPAHAFELWIGNPPYNGTSAVLEDKAAYGRLRQLLPDGFALPKGTSLRDDYAFFLLAALARLRQRAGALAFVTSATLLDAYLYSPLRAALLDSLELREVADLGPGIFAGTRVRTCVTVWTSTGAEASARFRRRRSGLEREPLRPSDFEAAVALNPRRPEYLLTAPDAAAEALDSQWRLDGEGLSSLVPISFPGLKTRFDELLVDADPTRLLARLRAFFRAQTQELPSFARQFAIPERFFEKLRRLHAASRGLAIDPRKVRPFLRYAGWRHRGGIPASARAFCYLDPRLIPRGDHRFRGDYDPHRCGVKLVYNARELPLSALVFEESGCIHDHRHARFAPLAAPALLVEKGLRMARSGRTLGPNVPNLSRAGYRLAERLGGPLDVFRMIAEFINSQEVQEVWAPVYGTTRDLPVPINRWHCALLKCSRSGGATAIRFPAAPRA